MNAYRSIEIPSLYDHQSSVVSSVRHELGRLGSVILQAEPGFGKTRCSKFILSSFLNRQPVDGQTGYAAFCVHRRNLVENAVGSFGESPSIPHGVVMSGEKTDWKHRLQVASIDTLLSWCVDRDQYEHEVTFDLVVFDECHSNLSTLLKWFEPMQEKRKELGLKPAYLIGLSATPSGKLIAQGFKKIICGPSSQWLIDRGFLSPFRYMEGTQGDLSKLVKRAAEYTEKSVAAAMDGLAGDLVRDWKQHAQGRPTVGFFRRISHSLEACEMFRAAGVKAEHVDAKTSDEDRARLFRQLGDGTIDYLCNVGIVDRGTNIPEISCVQLAVATASLNKFRQMIGRGSRTAEGKSNCLARGTPILTHRGLVPIEKVLYSDRVWDGVEFVSHRGVICKGIQDVITYQGLTATEEHRVKTEKGWRAFGDCAREQIPIVKTGFGGQTIRECENHFTTNQKEGIKKLPIRSGEMRYVQPRLRNIAGQLNRRKDKGLSRLQSAKEISGMASQKGLRAASTMHKQEQQKVCRLRRARNRVSVRQCFRRLRLDQRKYWSGKTQAVRQDRQRQALRTRKPSMVNSFFKPVPYSPEVPNIKDARLQDSVSRSELCRCDNNKLDRHGSRLQANRRQVSQPAFSQAKREIWDILNAGPRNCFTAQGMLVHNCLVIDHGGNIRGENNHGFFEDEIEWVIDNGTAKASVANPKPSMTCKVCKRVYRGGKCMNCGTEPTREEFKSEGLLFTGSELREITKTESKPKKKKTCEQILVSALYMAGNSGRTWKQAWGIAARMAEKQGTKFRAPKEFTVGGQTRKSIPWQSDDSDRKVSVLYPFTVRRSR